MHSMKKRILAAVLAALFCLLGTACSENQENKTGNETEEQPKTTFALEEELIFDTDDWSKLMGKTESWAGWANEGKVLPGQMNTVSIQKEEDLSPYRAHLVGFTDEDMNRILSDEDGACVLVEIAASTPYTQYSTISITRDNNFIDIVIYQDTMEEKTLSHSFYLYYFPSNIYQGEHINVSFVGDIG